MISVIILFSLFLSLLCTSNVVCRTLCDYRIRSCGRDPCALACSCASVCFRKITNNLLHNQCTYSLCVYTTTQIFIKKNLYTELFMFCMLQQYNAFQSSGSEVLLLLLRRRPTTTTKNLFALRNLLWSQGSSESKKVYMRLRASRFCVFTSDIDLSTTYTVHTESTVWFFVKSACLRLFFSCCDFALHKLQY